MPSKKHDNKLTGNRFGNEKRKNIFFVAGSKRQAAVYRSGPGDKAMYVTWVVLLKRAHCHFLGMCTFTVQLKYITNSAWKSLRVASESAAIGFLS